MVSILVVSQSEGLTCTSSVRKWRSLSKSTLGTRYISYSESRLRFNAFSHVNSQICMRSRSVCGGRFTISNRSSSY